MAGQFRKVAVTGFLGSEDKINCDVFEWQTKRYSKFKIRFLSPIEPGPRDFYIEPLLFRDFAERPTRFVEQACGLGYKILSALETHSEDDATMYRLGLALFRNRHAGHVGVRNLFRQSLDFVDAPGDGTIDLITPGLDAPPETSKTERHGTLRYRAARLLSKATNLGTAPGKKRRGVAALFALYEQLAQKEVARSFDKGHMQFDKLPLRNSLDLHFTEGLLRNPNWWDWSTTVSQVRSSLIYESKESGGQTSRSAGSAEIETALARLLKALRSNNQAGFDEWLGNCREHSFLGLLGATRLEGNEREEAAIIGRQVFHELMWMGYTLMSRCWGALMFLVYVDFCTLLKPEPSDEEKWLFRQRHFPQLFLAGLPLAFFETPQLRWIYSSLNELWRAFVKEPERYDAVTNLLGFYGALVINRRRADNRRKRGSIRAGELSENLAAISDEATPNDELVVEKQQLESLNCPHCGNKLQDYILLGTSGRVMTVEFFCPECDVRKAYHLDLDHFSGLLKAR